MAPRRTLRLVLGWGIAALVASANPTAVQEVTATRFPQNPLITVDTSASLEGNVNGPTVIRVPDWVDRPLGRYYMYFGHHMGSFIRMAYADAITGPRIAGDLRGHRSQAPGALGSRLVDQRRGMAERVRRRLDGANGICPAHAGGRIARRHPL